MKEKLLTRVTDSSYREKLRRAEDIAADNTIDLHDQRRLINNLWECPTKIIFTATEILTRFDIDKLLDEALK